MHALKIIATILNIAYFLIVLFFSRELNWQSKDDKASILGFGFMMVTNMLSILCFWGR